MQGVSEGIIQPEDAVPQRLGSLTAILRSMIKNRLLFGTVGVIVGLSGFWSAYALLWRITAPAPARSAQDVELVLVGDVMLSRNVARSVEGSGRDFTFPFQPTACYTRKAHVAFCNLESPISGRGERLDKRYTFNAPPAAIDGLTFAGFDVVSLANNHILDFGLPALEDTSRHLTGARIASIGLSNDDQPQVPAIFEINGVRIAFLAYAVPETKYTYPDAFRAFETRPAEGIRKTISRDIADLTGRADVLVLSLHWGREYRTEHSAGQEDLGRFIIDQGADVVAGHHPHVQQEPEWYNGGLIIYSMGNFVFDQYSRPATRVSRLYRVYVNVEGVTGAEYLRLEIQRHDWQPTPISTDFIQIPPPTG